VSPVYKRDLEIENYFIGYLRHPYLSFYNRARLQIALHLLPVAADSRRARLSHPQRRPCHRRAEYAKQAFPQVKEVFFDDDTLTDNLPRVEELAREIGKLGITWACNAKGNVPRKTLEVLADNGCRLFVVGYESGNQQILHNIKKGMLIDVAKKFTKDCHELGIKIHGTFILGLPGESKETIEQTIKFATEINPHIHPDFARGGRIPERTSTKRRRRTAGSTPTMPILSTTTASRSRRCTIRI